MPNVTRSETGNVERIEERSLHATERLTGRWTVVDYCSEVTILVAFLAGVQWEGTRSVRAQSTMGEGGEDRRGSTGYDPWRCPEGSQSLVKRVVTSTSWSWRAFFFTIAAMTALTYRLVWCGTALSTIQQLALWLLVHSFKLLFQPVVLISVLGYQTSHHFPPYRIPDIQLVSVSLCLFGGAVRLGEDMRILWWIPKTTKDLTTRKKAFGLSIKKTSYHLKLIGSFFFKQNTSGEILASYSPIGTLSDMRWKFFLNLPPETLTSYWYLHIDTQTPLSQNRALELRNIRYFDPRQLELFCMYC